MATLLEKIWNAHRVCTLENGDDLLYIDLHLVHEVTSPQAFDGLRSAKRSVRRPDLTFATMDHNVPTRSGASFDDAVAAAQMRALERNCAEFRVPLYGLGHERQGIVHVIGPELGLTQPGKTIVCGDSHTSTHGAFGALGFGIGTSEVEQVLATQCLRLRKPKTFQVTFVGRLPKGVFAKDMILSLIGRIGTAGATGFVLEYTGEATAALSMESRMAICNMSIEAGARAGLIAPDQTTFDFFTREPREFFPQGETARAKIGTWQDLKSDDPQEFDRRLTLDVSTLAPQVTWGTSPAMVTNVETTIPAPGQADNVRPDDHQRALHYMGLTPGTPLTEIPIDVVFIGSCTNSRLEDLRLAAEILKDRKVAPHVQVLVVPGSRAVRKAAEKEYLHRIFLDAGCEWREPGCSMCLGMNPDQLKPHQRCVATSNRNFEGRQGHLGRTHLASPATAAASALRGKISDPREFLRGGAR